MKFTAKKITAMMVLVLGIAIIGFLVFGEETVKANESERWTSSQDCASCHTKIYDEWKTSLHAQSWTDPHARALSNDFANTDCIACHAPRAVFETGIGNRVLARHSRRMEGVDCITCHVTEVGVVGAHAGKTGECRPIQNQKITSAEFCAGCHNQHGTMDEWKETEFAKKGITCNNCHMPHASHSFTVLNSKETIISALTCEIKVEGNKLTFTATNSGAGHDFPTDSKHKAVDLKYRFIDAAGKAGDWVRLARYRNPYRDDQYDLERTTIPSGGKKTHSVDLPQQPGSIEFQMFYKQNPFAKDEEALVIYQKIVEFGK